MKKYLTSITSPRGVTVSVAYYTDTPTKNYRVYYCGSDTGQRYEKIGNASRCIEKYISSWARHGVTDIKRQYQTRDEIPRRGSNA